MSAEQLQARYAPMLAVMNEDQLRKLASLFIVAETELAARMSRLHVTPAADKVLDQIDGFFLIATNGKEVEAL